MRGLTMVGLGLLVIGVVVVAACQPPPDEEGESTTAYPITETVTEAVSEESIEEMPEVVAILVVDDFQSLAAASGGEAESASPPPAETEEGKCAVTPDGQIFRGEGLIFRGEGLDWVSIPGFAHGVLVYNQLSDLLSISATQVDSISGPTLFADLNAGGATGSWSALGLDWMPELTHWEMGDQQIVLAMVDTNQYDSTLIATHLQAAMEALNSQYGATGFVWNMSFGFVPCNLSLTEEEYQQFLAENEDLQLLQESLNAAVAADQLTPEQADTYLRSQATILTAYQDFQPGILPAPFDTDPVLDLLHSDQPPGAIIAVAAAGNSGLTYPFAPAIWDDVIAVSSETKDLNSGNLVKANYANDGEVMMPDSYTFAGQTVLGTSFAAPQLSLQAAYYLLQGGMLSCTGAVDTAAPPFDYATTAGPWNNLSLSAAKVDYCPAFPP